MYNKKKYDKMDNLIKLIIKPYKSKNAKKFCSIKIILNSIEKEIQCVDIDLFYNKEINTKDKNDENNKKRELILENIMNFDKKNEFFKNEIYGNKWCNLLEKLKNILKINKNYDNIKIISKGGRGNNYDFTINYYLNKEIIYSIPKVEFKFGENKIENLPQILNLPVHNSTKVLKSESYTEYFKSNNYLKEICKIYNCENLYISNEEYLKNVSKTYYSCNPLFKYLYENEKKNKEVLNNKKILVNESIEKYLFKNVTENNIDYEAIEKKLKDTQLNKCFLLWDYNNFEMKYITEEDLTLTKEFFIKNNNTLVLKTLTRSIELLLRWKNRKGILCPAWQIKYGKENTNVNNSLDFKFSKLNING